MLNFLRNTLETKGQSRNYCGPGGESIQGCYGCDDSCNLTCYENCADECRTNSQDSSGGGYNCNDCEGNCLNLVYFFK